MSVGIQFRYNPAPLRAKLRGIGGAVGNTKAGPVRTGQDFAAQRYVQFLRRRYVDHSKGGGDWQPLAPATLAARKSEGFRGRRILVKSGKLLAGFRLGSVLTLQRIANGFRIAFSKTRLGKIAGYQDQGTEHIPARDLIVKADEKTLQGMRRDAEAGYKRAIQDELARAR